jgi:hypothetical protein
MRILINLLQGARLSFTIFRSYKDVIRKFGHDELAKKYIDDIDFINYRIYFYATHNQKMTMDAFKLELEREFKTSTSNVLSAYLYLKNIGFYDMCYQSSINLKLEKGKF